MRKAEVTLPIGEYEALLDTIEQLEKFDDSVVLIEDGSNRRNYRVRNPNELLKETIEDLSKYRNLYCRAYWFMNSGQQDKFDKKYDDK